MALWSNAPALDRKVGGSNPRLASFFYRVTNEVQKRSFEARRCGDDRDSTPRSKKREWTCRRNKPSWRKSISIKWLSKQLDRRDGEKKKKISIFLLPITFYYILNLFLCFLLHSLSYSPSCSFSLFRCMSVSLSFVNLSAHTARKNV